VGVLEGGGSVDGSAKGVTRVGPSGSRTPLAGPTEVGALPANGDGPLVFVCTAATGKTTPLERRTEIRNAVEKEAFESFNLSLIFWAD
jgi:hypothetical protein